MRPEIDPVRAIYDAAISGASRDWIAAMQACSTLLSSKSACLVCETPGGAFNSVSTGLDPVEDGKYNRYYGMLDPMPGLVRTLPPGTTVSCREALDRDDFDTEFFADWATPNEVADGLFVRLPALSGNHWSFALGRPMGATPVDTPAARARVGAIAAHLANGLAIQSRLQQAQRSEAAHRVADTLRDAWIVVRADGHVGYCNGAGERLLALRDGLWREEGVVTAFDADCHAALQALIRATARTSPEHRPADPLHVPRRSGRCAYQVRATPIAVDPESPVSDVALIVMDPAADEDAVTGLLQERYALTAAETRVVLLACKGRGLGFVAATLGVSASTTRIHLQHAFEKLDVHRQTELIIKVNDLRGARADWGWR